MAKEKREEESKSKSEKTGKRKHLHEIRSTQAHDGSIVHHHTYKESADHPFSEPERGPMATSSTPEEAGQHVAEMFGQNAMGGGGAAPGAAAGGGEAPEPEAAGAGPAQEA